MADKNCCPWKNGYYKSKESNHRVFLVNGERVKAIPLHGKENEDDASICAWEYGMFEGAREEIKDATGKTNYNVEISMWNGMWKSRGVINEEGTKITFWSFSNKLDYYEYITEEELSALKKFGDPASAPSNHYKIRPEFSNGRLLWVSGAPGLGKSTTGLLLSRKAGYIYYEADAFGGHLNPYIPPDVDEPSLATSKQKPLKDIPQERIDVVDAVKKDFMKMFKGEEYNKEKVERYYTALCKNIKAEKKRMGGDWVVAQAVPSRSLRDHIKNELGPDLVFVVFNMTKEEQMKRISERHGDENKQLNDVFTKIYDMFEPAQSDEMNVLDVVVTGDMTRDEVVDKVLNMLP